MGEGQEGEVEHGRVLTKVVPEVSRGYVRRREEFRGNNESAVRLVPLDASRDLPGSALKGRKDVKERERDKPVVLAQLFHNCSINNGLS